MAIALTLERALGRRAFSRRLGAVWLILLQLPLLTSVCAQQASEEVLLLPEFEIESMEIEQEAWPEEVPDPFPFGRDSLFARLLAERERDDTEFAGHAEQVQRLAEDRTSEFAMAAGAATPRGFATPRLRNGNAQWAFPEIIVVGKRDLLTGFLATYYGRTAPGGVLNTISRRPAVKPLHSADLRASSVPSLGVSVESNMPLRAKTRSARFIGSVARREGPEEFAFRNDWTAAGSVRAGLNRRTTLLVELESSGFDGNAAPEIPATREARGAKLGAPAFDLERFNANGPDARSSRMSRSASAVAEHRLSTNTTLRGGADWWERENEEFKFSTGAYLLDEHVFDGLREPEFNRRHEESVGMQVEIDSRLHFDRSEHRWVLGLEASRAEAVRSRRMLPREARDALPAGVRTLDPASPDFTMPPYSPSVYSRVVLDRQEVTGFGGVFLNDRFSIRQGRLNGMAGVRYDRVNAEVGEARSGEMATIGVGSSGRATYHAGMVGAVRDGGFAWYLNGSTAFQPKRRIDARTGRILANESTAGVEAGFRWEDENAKWMLSGSVYQLLNSDIARLNLLYNDPVLDPNRTQPQLVASGEERFRGAEATVRWKPESHVALSARGTLLEAITTSSPDLPEEVGRQLTRTPRLTGALTARLSLPDGVLKGAAIQSSLSWIGSQTANYEDSKRLEVSYGSYVVVNLSADYGWKVSARQHSVGLTVRNLFDRDLAEDTGKRGGEFGLEIRYRVRI